MKNHLESFVLTKCQADYAFRDWKSVAVNATQHRPFTFVTGFAADLIVFSSRVIFFFNINNDRRKKATLNKFHLFYATIDRI